LSPKRRESEREEKDENPEKIRYPWDEDIRSICSWNLSEVETMYIHFDMFKNKVEIHALDRIGMVNMYEMTVRQCFNNIREFIQDAKNLKKLTFNSHSKFNVSDAMREETEDLDKYVTRRGIEFVRSDPTPMSYRSDGTYIVKHVD
jgi:hypothetical protein